ncbi:MAG: hypothetical protein L6Q65_13850, partial [Zoogloea sp.]|nr:hypothetical protein [Zoogloea sp.]
MPNPEQDVPNVEHDLLNPEHDLPRVELDPPNPEHDLPNVEPDLPNPEQPLPKLEPPPHPAPADLGRLGAKARRSSGRGVVVAPGF